MQQPLSEREEIEALLPWLVTGRLGDGEAARVERYLEAHPEMKPQLAVLRGEMAATIATAEAAGTPAYETLDRLMRESGAERSAPWAFAQRTLEGIANWLTSLSRLQLGAMASAASLIIAVQAGSLLFLSGESSPRVVYETASGPRDGGQATGTFAIVAFKPAATAGAIAKLLEGTETEIVEGPRAGIWRVRLARDVKAPADAELLLARLKARSDLVAFAALAQ